MFLSLSKTFAKVGGFRLGLGVRMTKKNAAFLWLILLFVWMFKLMWYMLVLSFWLMYAMCYGIFWCIRLIFRLVKRRKSDRADMERGVENGS